MMSISITFVIILLEEFATYFSRCRTNFNDMRKYGWGSIGQLWIGWSWFRIDSWGMSNERKDFLLQSKFHSKPFQILPTVFSVSYYFFSNRTQFLFNISVLLFINLLFFNSFVLMVSFVVLNFTIINICCVLVIILLFIVI